MVNILLYIVHIVFTILYILYIFNNKYITQIMFFILSYVYNIALWQLKHD